MYSWGCPDEGALGTNPRGQIEGESEDVPNDGYHPSKVAMYPSLHGPNGITDDMKDGSGATLPMTQRREALITKVACGETISLFLSTE